MPLYEYKCEKCGHRFEKIEPFSAAAVKKCPRCGAKAERQISAAGIQFKGSGWYVTDYKGKSPAAGASENSASDGGSPDTNSGEAKATDSKTDSKSDSKSESKSESKDGAPKASSEKSSSKKKK